jgi:hypothetical protein
MRVSSRARRHPDRGGDPLDGLVNLFDLGIVLAVGFLIAALASLDLTDVLTDEEARAQASQAVTATESETIEEVELQPGERIVGEGIEVGRVYELEDGRTVIVREDGTTAETEPAPGTEPAPETAPGAPPPAGGEQENGGFQLPDIPDAPVPDSP